MSEINSLSPGRFEWTFRWLIFKLILAIDGWGIYCEIIRRLISLDITNDKSTLVQVMAWCRQAPSHYLCQCSPRSMLPYNITRPQWVNLYPTTTIHNTAWPVWIFGGNTEYAKGTHFGGMWSFSVYVCVWVTACEIVHIYSSLWVVQNFYGLVQDCGIFSTNALETTQSFTKPSV